jgi:hypothetical protein
MASTSRWKCIVPLAVPVVPEVKAISATSSAAVSTASKAAGLPRIRASSESSPPPPQVATRASTGAVRRAASSSSTRRTSHSATSTRAFSATYASSRARSSGMVATTMPPALSTANQAAAIICELGPRSSTRVPGTTPRSSRSTWAMRSACSRSSRYVQRPPWKRMAGRSVKPPSTIRSSSSTAALTRSGYASSGSAAVVHLRPQLRRRQAVAREGVHVGGRRCGSGDAAVGHRGTGLGGRAGSGADVRPRLNRRPATCRRNPRRSCPAITSFWISLVPS